MCRISWFWDFSKKADYNMKTVIDAMNDIQSHGGPDDNWTFLSKKDQFALGHRRLSILDLSKSWHQPMKHKDLIISYNGEVYNFKDIREELKWQWYKFTSDCDTEVIIKAFDKWGIKSVNKFRWMFAFAIFNKKKNELTLVRDRIGIKPIYYYRHKDILIFSSELKGIYKHPKFVKDVDHRWLWSYFKFGYVQWEWTILEHVFKVQPGSYVTINSDGEIEVNTYWSMIDIAKSKEFSGSMNDALTTGLDILRESVKLRMISDVPLWVFLSSWTDLWLCRWEEGAPECWGGLEELATRWWCWLHCSCCSCSKAVRGRSWVTGRRRLITLGRSWPWRGWIAPGPHRE